jgi:hypothetical protein
MVHPALLEVSRRRDRERHFQVRRSTGREQVLCGAEIRLPSGADIAISPGEACGPFNRIITIRHLPDQGVIFLSFRWKAPARVLHNYSVPALDKVIDIPWSWPQILVVRQTGQQDRKSSRGVGPADVGM